MGCSGSKADHLPLVVRCRERRDLIRAAANHRYALAAAHVSYFRSLKDVGDALRKFVDEELISASASSSSSFSSPSLTLPRNSKQKHDNADESPLHLHRDEDEVSHLNLSSSSSDDGDSDYLRHHVHDHDHHEHGHGHESEGDGDDGAHRHGKHHEHAHKWKKDFVHKGGKGFVHKGDEGFVHKWKNGSVHKGNKGSVHEGKDIDDEASHLNSDADTSSSNHGGGGFHDFKDGFRDGFGGNRGESSSHYHPGAQRGLDEYGDGFGNHRESTSHYPRGGFNGFGDGARGGFNGFGDGGRGGFNGFGDGFGSDPHMDQYTYPFQPPRQYSDPFMDQWGPQGMPPPAATQPWFYSNNSNVHYMKKTAPEAHTVVQEPPAEPSYGYSDSYWNSSVVGYGNAGNGGNYGYVSNNEGVKVNQQKKEAPPPPSPKASAWDFFNPFDGLNNSYVDYYSSGRYGYRTSSSSPDSTEVREREGIPDLEEETESEVPKKEVHQGNKLKVEAKKNSGEKKSNSHSRALPDHNNSEHKSSEGSKNSEHKSSEGNSGSVPQHRSEGSISRKVPLHNSEGNSKSVPVHNSESSSSRKVPLHNSEGNSKSVPVHNSESSSKSLPSWSSGESEKPYVAPQYNGDSAKKPSMPSQYGKKSVEPSISPLLQSPSTEIESSISLSDGSSSSEINAVSRSVEENLMKKKGVSFEVEEASNMQDGDSSKVSSLLLPNGTRDLREVVAEIRDEFETAAGYGKEVAVMLEVGKMPYQPSLSKVLSRILYTLSPSMSSRDPPSMQSAKLASKTMKLAKTYFEDVGKDEKSKACNLSSTLDRLYTWEKKLYKEVKDEEKLRIMYEKQCKKLKNLDQLGAESSKIDVTRASIRRLLTKLNVSVKAIDAISIRIQKLRDEELQPQVAELIQGLIRMWKAMFMCHQKQFRAVMESKMRRLKANTALQSDPTSRASIELERELRAWCDRFNEWIASQKSYVESLNEWLLHCLQYEPEETPDGPVPYSPGRLGAPPVFVICNDWHQAMKAISEARVANAMNSFASNLRQLWEKQDEEGRQRLRAEYLSKDYEKQLKANRVETGRDSGKTGTSVVPSDQSGVSALDDLKVDLDSMRAKVAEERVKHKDARKLVHDAASSSLQGGLVPIFKALEVFTSEALKAHEHVRLEHPGPGL